MHVRIPVDAEVELDGVFRQGERPLGVVLCHPLPAFGGNMATPLLLALEQHLATARLSTLRFDFRGVGASSGRPTGGHVEHEDVAAAVRWLGARVPRVAVCGYSFGALMAMRAAADGLAVEAAVAIGLPTVIVRDNPARIEGLQRGLGAVPWLLLTGDKDQFCELASLESWRVGLPAARLSVLPGVGHFYAPDQETRLGELVVKYLDEILGAGAAATASATDSPLATSGQDR